MTRPYYADEQATLYHGDEFRAAGWRLSHDIIWRKNTATGLNADRFRRTHEQAAHWYRGRWGDIHHEPVRVAHAGPSRGRIAGSAPRGPHYGPIGRHVWVDDGTRLAGSVIDAPNLHGKGRHPTEKPAGVLCPLIEFACPPVRLAVSRWTCSAGQGLSRSRLGWLVGVRRSSKLMSVIAR